ncbi:MULTISPECIES: SDR family NAD(P)-dependent oxidoreductase [unclassified Prochlorococcus]|uniref:SDR family NAD(P)-dependent oxidoreductase n=1 Tax=unclassified Prochlorococcus TaxID=2627481 RepID=UPI000533A7FB|nr:MULTISPECIES: SDR family NAD(P)-dependent oxidoreductase [unclassified Prochlorococcus]KGG15105.1 Short-chain dehydrogenase/reductase (SDR) :Glucose [Prochlorococcus sp. MIT 0602]KGG17377.1 Short-chain dehydrogenase/reductase (SDR) :Glucose [Prochlorococcus sp. MIT 0603]
MSENLRNIIITGASRGIGRSIAEKALEDGHNISIGIRNPEDIKGSILDPNFNKDKKIIVNKYDAKDQKSAISFVNNTKTIFNKIDTLIHCAGIFSNVGLNYEDNREKEIEDLWRVNLMGPWILTRESWKYLKQNNNSRIIILISMSGKRSKGKLAGYTASKFALMGLSQTIRNEGWGDGIRVTTICPGWVNTKMARNVKSIEKKQMTQPDDIGLIVSRILELPNTCIPFEISVNCNLEI